MFKMFMLAMLLTIELSANTDASEYKIIASDRDKAVLEDKEGERVYISKKVYNGSEVIIMENNRTYIPFSMFKKQKKNKK